MATELLKILLTLFRESTLLRIHVFEWHNHASRQSTTVNDHKVEQVKETMFENHRLRLAKFMLCCICMFSNRI